MILCCLRGFDLALAAEWQHHCETKLYETHIAENHTPYTLNPQLPSNIPEIPTIKDHKGSIKGYLGSW